jgi:hypothetical protein
MPGSDGTGPRGQGPRTGGGWGRCVPLPDEPDVVRGVGRGGLPWGGGRGRCWGGGGERFVGRGWWPGNWVARRTSENAPPAADWPDEQK